MYKYRRVYLSGSDKDLRSTADYARLECHRIIKLSNFHLSALMLALTCQHFIIRVGVLISFFARLSQLED
jgi:hypothetical protein